MTIPYAYVLMARGLGVCFLAGALLGAVGTVLRMWGEARGNQDE